jgi:ABC-2 type transport system permease protein
MNGAAPISAPLWLLVKTNGLQAWRRLLSFRDQSRLLSGVIGVFTLGYLWLSYVLFYKAMIFVTRFPGLGDVLVERMLYLLFAFLFTMLMLSNLVISYTNLFRNRETTFLLTMPVSTEVIFRWKFIESSLLASWAFIFLIAPLVAAFGQSQHAPWHFYPVTVLMILLFIVLPTVVGSAFSVVLARFMDRRAFQVAAISVALVALFYVAFGSKPEELPDDFQDTRVLGLMDRLLKRTDFAQNPLLPSYWLSTGVLNWLEGAFSGAGFFATVLLSNVLFFGFLCFTRLGRPFYEAASVVQSRGSLFGHWEWFRKWRDFKGGRRYETGFLERAFVAVNRRMPGDVRAMLVKDIRVFWRDTTQWGQTLMLFGLLGVYIINLRHFSQQLTAPFWIHVVSYLNLGASALNLATLTTRFVYPQFSLEGRRVWIVGLVPLGLPKIVTAKYWLTTIGSLIVTLGLNILSCHMLKLPWERTLMFAGAITVMTLTLNGLAVGLGVLYPNFREDNPSKIVSGFGGTFCLVLSFLYIVASVVLLAMGTPWPGASNVQLSNVLLGWIGFGFLSALLGWVPFKLGLRRAANFEY